MVSIGPDAVASSPTFVARRFRATGDPSRWLSYAILGCLLVLVVPPAATLVVGAFTDSNSTSYVPTLAHFRELFGGSDFYRASTNTLIFAFFSTILSLVIGTSLAWIVERTDAPFKPLAYLTTIISMGTPYALYVTAWLSLFGRVGPFNEFYRALTGSSENFFNVNSLWGMILIEGFLWSPLVFLMLTATFRAANAEMEEAARMAGATVLTIWRISVPLSLPALLALALFVFIRNIEAFDVPALVGIPGRISVLTTEVYSNIRRMPPRLGTASAFAVVMLIIVAVLLALYGRLARNADKYASIMGKGFRPRPFQLGRVRWVAGVAIIVNFSIVLGLPLLALVWSSIMPYARGMSWSALRLATWRNYETVLSSHYYAGYALRTVLISAAAATTIMAITVIGGWLAVRRKPGGALIDQLAAMPLVFPGIVLGMAMLEVSLFSPLPLYGTVWIICIAFVVRYLPYGMRYSYSGALQIHRELEEAAGMSGASPAGILRRIVLPLLSPAVLSGWLFIFLISAKELSISLLLVGPGSQTIPVAMFELWGNGQSGELSAFGLIWTAAMTVCASGFYIVARRSSQGAFAK